jgi:hypothetical protein
MWGLVWKLVELGIDKFSDYKVKKSDDALEIARIREETEQSKDKWKAVILTSTGAWWFQLFFIVPLAAWFSLVVVYSMFWCKGCMYPQPWTIAALPSPLNEWAGAIIAFLFLTNTVKR